MFQVDLRLLRHTSSRQSVAIFFVAESSFGKKELAKILHFNRNSATNFA